jgi:hypothetical protein
MRKTDRDLYRLALLGILSCPALALCTGITSKVQINDSSDWWSMLNEKSREAFVRPQHREPAASNFQILGAELGEEVTKITSQLGPATVVERGDGAAGRSQVCYESADGLGNVHLIFERGEVNNSFYLFTGGDKWKGIELCVKSKRVFRGVSSASGLALGLPPEKVESILGDASSRTRDKLVYEFEVNKTISKEEFDELRKRFPDQSVKELHESYDKFTLTAHIEARFGASGLNYLVVSKSEVY